MSVCVCVCMYVTTYLLSWALVGPRPSLPLEVGLRLGEGGFAFYQREGRERKPLLAAAFAPSLLVDVEGGIIPQIPLEGSSRVGWLVVVVVVVIHSKGHGQDRQTRGRKKNK